MNSDIPTVVLINPPVYDFSAYDLWARPFGLLTIAGHLLRCGVRVKLIDSTDPFHPDLEGLRAPKRRGYGAGKFFSEEIPKPAVFRDVQRKFHRYGLPPDRFERAMCSAGNADAALVTCAMTYWYPGAFEAIALARKIWPKTPVLLGGVYATLCNDHAGENSGADAVLPGPWEKSQSVFKDVTGISIAPASQPLFRPALDLYPRLEYAPIMLSRGCPLRCSSCASGMLFEKYVRRAPSEVFEEIQLAVSRGISDFTFYDDALLWDAGEGIIPLLEKVLEHDLHVRFHAPNGLHFSKVDRRLAKLMRRAGFVTIRLGVESLSKNRHEQWGGKADFGENLTKVASYFRDAGYNYNEIGAYLLAGFPGQSAEELEDDIKSLISLGIRPYLAEYSPLPGTPMFENARKVSRYDVAGEPLAQNNSALPCASPEFTPEDLQRLKHLSWPNGQ